MTGFSPTGFWRSFAEECVVLREEVLQGDVAVAYLRIGDLLTASNCPFVYELTRDESRPILVFTPESDPDTAMRIDQFVASAPLLPTWTILSRRQRKPVEDVFEILAEVYQLDARDSTFSVYVEDGRFSVVMHTSVADDMTANEGDGFVSMFLEHALGRRSSHEKNWTKVCCLYGMPRSTLTS